MNTKRSLGFTLLALFCLTGVASGVRVLVPDGTPVPVRLKADLRSDRAEPGDRVDFEVARTVMVRGLVVIPEGAIAWGAVQSVKKDKEVKFDVQGLRLPNLQEIKLRSVREKTKSVRKDQIKLETDLGTFVGAFRGTEFMAYVDEPVDVEGVSPTAGPPTPAPAVTAPVVTRPAQPTTPTVTAQPAAVTTPAPAAPATPAAAAVERVTMECFSVPSGAEILIDGDFYGHTPSILKLTATSHRIDIQLSGYKTYSQALSLTPQTQFSTIRAILEKKE